MTRKPKTDTNPSIYPGGPEAWARRLAALQLSARHRATLEQRLAEIRKEIKDAKKKAAAEIDAEYEDAIADALDRVSAAARADDDVRGAQIGLDFMGRPPGLELQDETLRELEKAGRAALRLDETDAVVADLVAAIATSGMGTVRLVVDAPEDEPEPTHVQAEDDSEIPF